MKTEDVITLEESWQDINRTINKPIDVYISSRELSKEISKEMKTELDKLRKIPIEIGDIIKFKRTRKFDRHTSYGLVKEIHKIKDSLIEENINEVIYVVELLNSETGIISRIDVFEKDIICVYDIK